MRMNIYSSVIISFVLCSSLSFAKEYPPNIQPLLPEKRIKQAEQLSSRQEKWASKEIDFKVVKDESNLKIETPSLARRETAKLRLANGLEIYLISDPDVDQSAAALAVEVGSWSDPVEYPGMAHFLEHMLFMGTGAYPKESEYMQYIGDHGGKVNAYTASDRTVYMFSINNNAFEGALDRFSHFFIDPLFQPSSIDRELLAVDQEHSKNIENDGWRQYMVFRATGKQDHPNAKFSTGNADTLRGIPQEAMKSWYDSHYSAQRMHLVVLSSLPLSQLIEITTQDFAKVPQRGTGAPASFPLMTSEEQRGHFIYIKPVKEIKNLSISWELTADLAKEQETKVGDLLSYILRDAREHTLLSVLKNAGLVESISSSESVLSKTNKIFCIDFELTDKGVEHTDQIISLCFETLARLKKEGIPRYVYNEMEKMAVLSYAYQSRKDAFVFVSEAAHTLVDENLETYPRKTYLPTKYQPQVIHSFLSQLTPDKGIYCVMAPSEKSGVTPTLKEKWMGAEYTLKPINAAQLSAWKKSAPNPDIFLPPPNSFIPTNLTLVDGDIAPSPQAPALLEDGEFGKAYFSGDNKYLLPEVCYLFRFKSPLLNGSARSHALLELYLKAMSDLLSPLTANAEMAGLSAQFISDHYSFALSITGYSDKAGELVRDILQTLKQPSFSQSLFDLYKESLSAQYQNSLREPPFKQSFDLLRSVVFNDAATELEKLKSLEPITYETFLEFSKEVLKKSYVESILYGNLTQETAEQLWHQVKQTLQYTPYPISEHYSRKVLVLPEAGGPYMLSQTTPMQGNAALLLVEQGPYSIEKRSIQQILSRVLKEGFFDTLRTKQQTAYIARALDLEEAGQLFQTFAVQSTTHQPGELIARFELFLENLLKEYNTDFSPDRFETIRAMSIATLKMPPENLSLMGYRLFNLAFEYDGDFQLIEKRIAALETLTYDQVKEEAFKFFSRENGRRLAILIEGSKVDKRNFRYELTSKEALRQQGNFVAWR